MSQRIGVLHIVDQLSAGGKERAAVHLVNHLPRDRFRPHLCTVRSEGPISGDVAGDVSRLHLDYRGKLDPVALRKLIEYTRRHDIRILHAHGSSIYLTRLASMALPGVKVVWHFHFGRYGDLDRAPIKLRVAARGVDCLIAVSERLAGWCRNRLPIPPDRVLYIPNFVPFVESGKPIPSLPGKAGGRIACVAGLRPEKDHLTLIRAMSAVADEFPDAHLLLVGPESDPRVAEQARDEVRRRKLEERVHWLGLRDDVTDILRGCDIGVLSSTFEGFPLALIEYGVAGVAPVTTDVGQCAEVTGTEELRENERRFLVSPGSPDEMAGALRVLLDDPEARRAHADRFHQRVRERYSPKPVIERISRIYESVIEEAPPHQSPKGGILMVGNFFASRKGPCGVCEELADRLAGTGWRVISTSRTESRVLRLLDMTATAIRRRNDYDSAQVDLFSGSSFRWAEAVCRVLRLLRKPYVLTLHGGSLPGFAQRQPDRVRRLLQSAAVVTAPSRYLQETMKPYREGIRLLPNPVRLEGYPFESRRKTRPRLVWLRTFKDLYNPMLFPRVLALLANDHPDIMGVMVGFDAGDGALDRTRETAERLSVSHRITFEGPVAKSMIPRTLLRGDIYLNTPRIDNTPVTVLEAMACGLCIVSTNVGGIPFLLEDGVDALLTPSDDAEAMAGAVRRILTEPELAGRLSHAARRKAETSDWSVVLPIWESIFRSFQQPLPARREDARPIHTR